MRRFLSTAFIALALLVGAAGGAPAAHAQTSNVDTTELANELNAADATQASSLANTALDPDGSITAANIAADKAAQGSVTELPKNPDGAEGFSQIMILIMSLFAWLVGVAAITLNYAVYYTVVTMGKYVHDLSAVGVTWRILRDIANIMFIFGFLGAGISTILNLDLYGWKTKMLPMLVVGAVFLNFSLFITEALIDTSNLFATQFYTQIVGGTLPTAADMANMTTASEGISNKIMSQLGLQTIYDTRTNSSALLKAGNSWIIGFMGILLFIVTAFVLFSLAFILIARFVALIFFMILSPVGFMGLAIPQMKFRADQWWENFLNQVITAPILLLLLYVALAVITDAQFLTGFNAATKGSGWLGTVTNNLAAFAPLLLSFLVAMGLLLVVVIKAKGMGALGASTIMKFGKSAASGAANFAGRSALGVGKYTVRQTAGRGAHVASQAVMRSSFGQTQAGRLIATGLGKGGKSFKDAKDKSIKSHEEYVKSVHSAIEEKHAPALVAAQLKRDAAEKTSLPGITAAKAEQEAAVKAAKPLTDEVKRLEAIISAKGKFDPERIAAERDIVAAKNRAAPAEARVKAADDIVAAANAPLAAAIREETEATKALKDAKKEAALAYAQNTSTTFMENPVTWAMTGTGASAAANKIFKDTLKKMSDNEKLLDELKKSIAKEVKASDSSAETSEKLSKAKEDLKEKTEDEAGAGGH